MNRFVITKDYSTQVRRFNVRGRKVEFNIKPVPNSVEPTGWIKGAIEDIVKYVTQDVQPNEKIGITFCGQSFEERGPGWVNFKDAGDISSKDIWDMISKIFQSNSEGLNTDTFCLAVTSVRLPQGKGSDRAKKYNNFFEECSMRRGIVTISNEDNLCLPRALVVAIAYAENDPDYKKIRKDARNLQTQKSRKLLEESKVNIPDDGAGVSEVRDLQDYLKSYKIVVYQYGSKGRDLVYEGVNEGKRLNLLYHRGHFNVITSLTAAFCCVYYCENCNQPYNTKNDHRCGGTCPCCQQSPACVNDVLNIRCEDCSRSFRGKQCFENHRIMGSLNRGTVCDQVKKCLECLKVYKANKNHVCGEVFCKNCGKHVPQEHLCFIQPDIRTPLTKDVLYIFYDLETRQQKIIGQKTTEEGTIGEIRQHEPCLCVAQLRCDRCVNADRNVRICVKCGIRELTWQIEPIKLFLNFVLKQRKIFKKVIVIAHNGQAFDHQFMLNFLLQETNIKPQLIMRGTKIVLMQLGNVKFLDSLNYFPMALSKLPKAFDLPQPLKKGYFPHLFNTEENKYYTGQLPPLEYYSPDTMKTEDRKTFLKWYDEHKNDQFNMQHDLKDYCKTDVQILTDACLKFRIMFLQECNVEPFLEATTIASACNLVFRRNFLKPNTIGIIPKNGYRFVDNQSKEAMQWLIWEEDKRKINIQHAGKQREAIVNGVKVDGWCRETNQVFEFHGCYYHGHPSCLRHNRDAPLHDDPKDTLNLRYERTTGKTERLRSFGYEVIEMWACEFKKQMMDKSMEYLNHHPLLNIIPLKARDAFYGGRTGNTYMYYKCKDGEKIKYFDVCSLYPWVCKNAKFPTGHPTVHVGNDACCQVNLYKVDGLIKCKLLPPENLLHPVLPVKQNNKLMFSLCRSCGENKNQDELCTHSDEERAIMGTWVTDEVKKALDKGYQLLEVYEIWSYTIKQYDKLTSTEGLFTGMMNKFIKIKQQASGWPLKCTTQEEKDQYIEDFLNNEGIKLEFALIINNAGLRSLAKLILNSFWGKFGQRENQQKTSIINKPSELYELLTNAATEVCHILPVNENTIIVNWEYKEEVNESLSTVNVCIASYTTAQARLKLYSYLEQLGDRVLYYDTDSVIYISREGEYDPPTGEFVGEMTDELECYGAGSYITEFVSGGPKNYAYKIYSTEDNSEKIVCKVKGICLNYAASQQVNFETIKKMVLNPESEDIQILSENIRRTANHEIVTVPELKKYKPMSEKRRFLDDYSSVPFGFKRQRLE